MINIQPRAVQVAAFFLLSAMTLGIIAGQAYGIETPRSFVQRLVDRAVTSLAHEQADAVAKRAKMAEILRHNFDLKKIGRLVLGKHYRTANPQERALYETLFGEYLIATYADRLSASMAETSPDQIAFTITDVAPSRKDQIVNSVLQSGSQQFEIDWRVRKMADQWRILDVMVEGISLVITHRNEFGSIIAKSGNRLGPLNDHLRQKIAVNQKTVHVQN